MLLLFLAWLVCLCQMVYSTDSLTMASWGGVMVIVVILAGYKLIKYMGGWDA